LNILWFLFQYGRSDDPRIRKLIVFPFYGRYLFGSKKSGEDRDGIYSQEFMFITPFYATLQTHSALLASDDVYFLPFFMHSHVFYRKERETEDYWKVWPLVSVMTDSNGNFAIRALTLWPFRSDEFDRAWGPYYSLFEYNRYANRDRYFSLLLRAYSRYWNEREEHHFILGFNIDQSPQVSGVEFLGGFLGFRREYTRMETTKNVARVLWFSL